MLHQVVDRVPALKSRVCGYPECFHPPRAAVRSGGRPPAYCDVVRDARGQDAHTAIRSMRRRQQLRDGVAGRLVEPGAVSAAGERPVSYARQTVPVTASRVEQVVTDAVAAISRGLDELRQQVALLGDDEAAAAEIEGIRHDAAQEVEQATGARLTAEQEMRRHKSAADQAHAELGEAIAAAEEPPPPRSGSRLTPPSRPIATGPQSRRYERRSPRHARRAGNSCSTQWRGLARTPGRRAGRDVLRVVERPELFGGLEFPEGVWVVAERRADGEMPDPR